MIMLKFIIAIYLYYRWSDLIFRFFLNGSIAQISYRAKRRNVKANISTDYTNRHHKWNKQLR